MTDANLMDAKCIHGNTWWECTDCEQLDVAPVVEPIKTKTQRHEASPRWQRWGHTNNK